MFSMNLTECSPNENKCQSTMFTIFISGIRRNVKATKTVADEMDDLILVPIQE